MDEPVPSPASPVSVNRGLTQERLKELLHYDPETGIFRWRKRTARCVKIGEIAGSQGNGYWRIQLDGVQWLAHRLAWLYMTGEMPEEVDHRDMNRGNNRWVNLRNATTSQNQANRPAPRDNKSGFKGVHWHSRNKRYHATIVVRGARLHLGVRKTAEEAHTLYKAAAKRYFGDYARSE